MTTAEKVFVFLNFVIAVFALIQAMVNNSAIYAVLFTLNMCFLLNRRIDLMSEMNKLNSKRIYSIENALLNMLKLFRCDEDDLK